MPSFDTSAPIIADLDVEVGRARVIAGERATTVVDVRPANEKRRADVEAAERTRVEFAAGHLEIRASRARYLGLLGRPGAVEVMVQLPAGSQIRGQIAYGDFDVEGQAGDCSINTSYGNLRVDAAGAATLHTSAGNITLGRATGTTEISSSWGNIRIGEAGGATDIKTAGGEIVIQRAAAAIHARTSYGEVRVAEAVRGSLTLETSYGNVGVGVARGTAAFLDVTSGHGRVNNELVASADRSESTETLTVRARTSFGDITIRRA